MALSRLEQLETELVSIRNDNNAQYRPISLKNLDQFPQWRSVSPEVRRGVELASLVFPFRTNAYVIDHLIDWSKVPADPVFQLSFVHGDMLVDEDRELLDQLVSSGADNAA
ncbi:MAG: hypothetical protein HQL32_14920, partial [Planctomycetes bacterium]|nr:hypothetical protein [Planctomycetota bacterium]